MSDTTESLLIPPEFYFQTTFEIPFQEDLESVITGGNHPQISVPLPHLMFKPTDSKPLGTIHVAWNDAGLAISAEIELPQTEKKKGSSSSMRPELDFFIDTRDMKSNKRANRFCHRFQLVLPTHGVKNILPEKIKLIALTHSQSNKSASSQDEIPTAGSIRNAQHHASCWLSKDVLTGFDPENVPSIGFFYVIKTHNPQLGNQPYGLNEDFPYTSDPGLWPSLKLSR